MLVCTLLQYQSGQWSLAAALCKGWLLSDFATGAGRLQLVSNVGLARMLRTMNLRKIEIGRKYRYSAKYCNGARWQIGSDGQRSREVSTLCIAATEEPDRACHNCKQSFIFGGLERYQLPVSRRSLLALLVLPCVVELGGYLKGTKQLTSQVGIPVASRSCYLYSLLTCCLRTSECLSHLNAIGISGAQCH